MFSRYFPHIRLLHKLAWGGSVAGLTLLAEERRRRLAFAQKVLDNGNALQTYKSYKSSAPLSTFDASATINFSKDYNEQQGYTQQLPALTAEEWRTRRRKRRLAPSGDNSKYRNRLYIAKRTPLRCTKDDVGDEAGDMSNPPMLSCYELYLHKLVANRMCECLGDDSLKMNLRAQEELDAFLSQSPKFLSPCMQHILASYNTTVRKLPSLDPGKAMSYKRSFNSTSSCVENIIRSTPDTGLPGFPANSISLCGNLIPANQNDIAAAMSAFLDQNRIHDAFIQFLRLCECITEPLLVQTQCIITNLASVCKQRGAYSLVKDIELKALEYLNYWRLVAFDLAWLLSNETSEKGLTLSRSVIMSFWEKDAHIEAAQAWFIATSHLLDQGDIDHAADLFFEYEALIKSSDDSFAAANLGQRLLLLAASKSPLDVCLKFVRYLLERGSLCSDLLSQVCNIHFRRGDKSSAISIYVAALGEASNPVALHQMESFSTVFISALESQQVGACVALAELLRLHNLPLSANILQATISLIGKRQWLDAGANASTFEIVQEGKTSNTNGVGSLHRLLAALFSMAHRNQLQDYQNNLFEAMVRIGAVDYMTLERMLAILFPTKTDVIVDIGRRCDNLDDATLLSLEFILVSAVEQRDKDLSVRVLREIPLLTGLSADCLIRLARSISLFRDEHLTQNLIAAVLNRKLSHAILLLKDDVLHFYRDNQEAMLQLYVALAKHQDLTTVPDFVLKMPPLQRSSDIVQDWHCFLLRRCWESTRNLQLFTSIYKSIQNFDPTQYPTKPLYLELISVYLEKGKHEQAAFLLHEMAEKAGFPTDLETITVLMLPEARRGNWKAVKDVLIEAMMECSEISQDGTRRFDDIFEEHCKQHCAKHSLDFLELLDARFSMPVTTNMIGSLVDVIANEQSLSLAIRLQKLLHSKGVKMRPTRKSLELIMMRLKPLAHLRALPWNISGASPCGNGQMLIGMLNDIVKHEGENGAYLTPYINNNTRLPTTSRIRTSGGKARHTRQNSGVVAGNYLRKVQRLMLVEMRAKHYNRVLRIYKASLHYEIPLRRSWLSLAVHAAILRDRNGLDGAHGIIREAQKMGVTTEFATTPLLLREFRVRKWDESDARSRIFKHYHFLETHQMRLNHFAALSAAQNLLHFSCNPHAGLRLLNDVRNSEWANKAPFDLPALTMFLKLCIETCDAEGVKWVIRQVYARRLEIDGRFKRALRNGRKRLLKFASRRCKGTYESQSVRHQHLAGLIRYMDRWGRRFAAINSEQSDRALDFASAFSTILQHEQDDNSP